MQNKIKILNNIKWFDVNQLFVNFFFQGLCLFDKKKFFNNFQSKLSQSDSFVLNNLPSLTIPHNV